MRFSVIGSGSGGNSIFIQSDRSSLLIDAGFSIKELKRRLERLDISSPHIEALLVTHEHNDHIKGIGSVLKDTGAPLICNAPTLNGIIGKINEIDTPYVIHTGQSIEIDDIQIETFSKCHDAADPIGVIISHRGIRLGIITDLGRSTYLVEDRLKFCHALIIEFNHDLKMLHEGPYPLELKRRIRGNQGHLSNEQASRLLNSVCHRDLKVVVLAHLSKVNNIDKIAYMEAERTLRSGGLEDTHIIISYQDEPTPLISI